MYDKIGSNNIHFESHCSLNEFTTIIFENNLCIFFNKQDDFLLMVPKSLQERIDNYDFSHHKLQLEL